MKLIIGNKTYSSWSMRPWILMRHFDLPFEEQLIKLDLPSTPALLHQHSPSAKVPVLLDGDLAVWESLAIMEYLHELFPEKGMYPDERAARARARCLAHEMHGGFSLLRQHLSFHAKRRVPNHDLTSALKDIERIRQLWAECLEQSGGPFLMGKFGIVDAMYAPVVGRFVTYVVPLAGSLAAYRDEVMKLPAVMAWYDGAQREDFLAPNHE